MKLTPKGTEKNVSQDNVFAGLYKTLPEAQRTQKLTPRLGLNLATTWRHLHQLQIWPPDGAT